MPASPATENNGFLKHSQIFLLGLCIAIATIFSTFILSQTLMKMKAFSTEVINVRGSAEKKIISDMIVWRSEFSSRDIAMTVAFQKLKDDLKLVQDYLVAKGLNESEITINQVDTQILYKKNEKGHDTNEIEGYVLKQSLDVQSNDVLKVTGVSREATELINQGVQFISYSPEFFYTQLPELKLEMLAEASKDAKKRADQMASSTGNKIGSIRSAKMGVFQITPANSYDVSDYGMNDTSSYEKKATAVVNIDFSISN